MKIFTLAIATMCATTCAFGAALSADAQETYVVEDPSIDPTITACAQGGTYEREFGITQDPTAGLQMDIDYRAIRRVA